MQITKTNELIKVYGINNCDTIKKTKKFLDENHLNYEFIDFRKTPLSTKDINLFIEKIGLEKLINKRSTTWKKLSKEQQQNITTQIILEYPTLMKRPIVIKNNDCFVGFEQEKFLKSVC
ncbi:FIG138056: a glutathione-dependent thiol reductase [hydrothermal vent metagenome]|uniref:FIG138056: a glutathione-dependent thiol reductase n=1 Tax=hydrothermal vent metagenome TaxID=652676 RepID=A0A1W1CE11_9ZZZZ